MDTAEIVVRDEQRDSRPVVAVVAVVVRKPLETLVRWFCGGLGPPHRFLISAQCLAAAGARRRTLLSHLVPPVPWHLEIAVPYAPFLGDRLGAGEASLCAWPE